MYCNCQMILGSADLYETWTMRKQDMKCLGLYVFDYGKWWIELAI